MKTDLLLKLADLLEADANNPHGVRFNLGTWITTSKGAAPEMSCGTQACAMGLAAISGIFKDEGLTYDHGDVQLITSHGLRYSGFFAAARLFKIDVTAAIKLFSPDAYDVRHGIKAELAVAERIRKGVATGDFYS